MPATAKQSQTPQAVYMREYRARKRREKSAEAVISIPEKNGPEKFRECGADEICNWIEATLRVPTGPLAGRPFVVAPFQREWLHSALVKHVQEAGMSIARKNGKSGFIAGILLAGLCGPLNSMQWRGVVTSLTGNLAKELRDAVMLTAEASGIDGALKLMRAPPPGLIYGINHARLDFLAADKATGHAIGADLAIIDEAGLLQENKRALWNALYSSISGRNGRFWSISIQGDGPMFAELEQRAGSERVHFRKWATDLDAELDDEAAWHDANPALIGGIKSLDYMRSAAERALASPGNEMHFRAYDLNQPVDPDRQVILSLGDYRRCVCPDVQLEGDAVVGIDLGGSASMTCAAAYVPATGALRVWGAFGDDPPITARARNDRMGSLYDRMLREGELKLYPGKVTPVVPFLVDVFNEIGSVCRIAAIGADRYRRAEAQQAFQEAGLHQCAAHWRGQGAGKVADGSTDVRSFQKAAMSGKLRVRSSSMLEAAIANSVLRFDNSGNPALDKSGNNARIDALSAAVIAVGIGEFMPDAPLFGVKSHIV